MSILPQELKALAGEFLADSIAFRRHLHRHPEPSYHEEKTAAFLAGKLSAWGIGHQTGVGGYGIKAIITGTGGPGALGQAGRVVALRADMDALPVTEESGLDFASEVPGMMHACGHDAHSTILLTTCRMLEGLKDRFRGTVVALFQPAEEKCPGGAQAMIADGALRDPVPDVILGEHVNPGLDAGQAGFRPGLMMASADELYITILGKGGHGASPHHCVDPVVISAQIITALQQVVSRQTNPEVPAVLTFGRIEGKGATNIIPPKVEIDGTFRCTDEAWRQEVLRRLPEMIQGLARALGGEATVQIEEGYPPVYNDPALNRRCQAAACEILGTQGVEDLPLVMWAEDFSRYSQVVPGCFYNIGIRNRALAWDSPLHSPTLRVDESVLETGPALMAWLALRELDQAPKGL